ncbi:hypothetical protein [Streptomyces sp. NBC_00239]|uniref:hypothetical protein n=1 Tax=Streptomyces sp. NBC_00239 TaxID=2903640 RepID=UPI002E2C42AB|nr:hypothetical protein [Streptomyces sp. NBC_00239]
MHAYQKKTAGALLAAALLAVAATGCEDGAKEGAGKAADGSKAAGGAVNASPAVALERAKKKSKDISSLRYTMSGQTPEGKVAAEARLVLKPKVAMSMKMESPEKPGEKFEVRLVDGAMYIGGGAETAKELGGKRWMKLDMKALNGQAPKQLDSLGSQSGQNPADQASELSAAKDLKKVGDESIDGQPTTHYAGTVTLDQMRAGIAADPQTKERREKSLKQYEDLGIKALNMDMWIGKDDTTKQFRIRAKGTKGPVDMTVKFLDYNKSVQVTAPPAGEVMDLAAMMKGAGKA